MRLLLKQVSLRQLRAVRHVAKYGSVSAAAQALNRTQPAVSRSLAELEAQLGVPLFDRLSFGVVPTSHGLQLVERIKEAEREFERARLAYQSSDSRSPSLVRSPVFTMEISLKRLFAFLAVHEHRDVGRAAEANGVTRAAIYNSLKNLETLLGGSLFERSGDGMRPTTAAADLANHLSLACALLQIGLDEVVSGDGEVRGNVVAGTLPYVRTAIIPRAIVRVLQDYPRVQITTREGPYDTLERALRRGDIDLIVGATRPKTKEGSLRTQNLLEDELAVICGTTHPLASQDSVRLDQILEYGWVLPMRNTPARRLFNEFLSKRNRPEPRQIVETGSLSTARGLLMQSNFLALLSVHQIEPDRAARLLTALPIRLEETHRPIGITTRASHTPSPAARVFLDVLRTFAA